MRHDEVVELTGNILILILAVAMGSIFLYGYTHASSEDQDLMFWFMVTQPQE